ncbi:hypothetical protein EG68_06171 [Paragonimus skrjabini miyazakii]|uniref:Uncharacterized protein n=1 Tax=Paragonimus skrjabini miyazakii TaxID=59628 RepID=A0A8S9Z1K5_9TREM|nr:hypothetical protein EG68_06171 [Paragonimus skrjabini miyazakii]
MTRRCPETVSVPNLLFPPSGSISTLRLCVSLKDCCWNCYYGRTLSPGISTLPQSWVISVTDNQCKDDRLVHWNSVGNEQSKSL